jgi:hypothetical protein
LIERARASALACALALASCYSPTIDDGQFSCSQAGDSCPSGFHCLCGSCRLDVVMSCYDGGGSPIDAALDQAAPDLSGMDAATCALPGCTNGCRSLGDPGIAKVAFCPAAWQLAGLNTPAGCFHQPMPNGKNAAGMDCAASDNCANGWHICNSESELLGDGLTVNECDAIGAAVSGLWLTAQIGDAPMTDLGLPAGPPQCNIARAHFAFGCGSLGMTPNQCTLLNRVLVDPPGSDPCAAATSGAFSCPSPPVMDTVRKPILSGGGVICCVN